MFGKLVFSVLSFVPLIALTHGFNQEDCPAKLMPSEPTVVTRDETTNKTYSYDRHSPFIFIGGMPRSGTTLLRAMLDSHPDVRCGQETHIIPALITQINEMTASNYAGKQLENAAIGEPIVDSAMAAFILEIIVRHGPPANRLCNKDPLTLMEGPQVLRLFPNSKYIFMIRDGRAVVHSILTRNITIAGFDKSDTRRAFLSWNLIMKKLYDRCQTLGSERCFPVYYEKLILQPELWARKILDFLQLPWNDSVLQHEKFINKPEEVMLSMAEMSSDQVIKPINTEALSKWIGFYPDDIIRDMDKIAPMLKVLGYDPNSQSPEYGEPDSLVLSKMADIENRRNDFEAQAQLIVKMRQEIFAKQEQSSDGIDKEAFNYIAYSLLANDVLSKDQLADIFPSFSTKASK